jgi:alpha-tubulin suppressor-like RCC1 family protein
VCWGLGTSGQLGNGAKSSSSVPVTVTGLNDAIAIAVGGGFTCAVRQGGGVMCWGSNTYGQLGNGTTTSSATPVAVSGLTDAVAIAATEYSASTCALRRTGGVVCWGEGASGALGNGSSANSSVPVAVTGITNAVGVAATYEAGCAVLATGGVVCWGNNGLGQLGNGTTTSSTTPVAVTGLTDATATTGGGGPAVAAVCAAHAGGTVSCWGNGSTGQLGDNSTASSTTPVTVSGLSNGLQTAMGGGGGTSRASACAMLTTGGVECWGANLNGQLGNGSTTQSNVPVSVVGFP